MTKTDKTLLSQIKPNSGYLLVEPDEAQKQTASGIYLPDSASADKPQQGLVLSVGGPTFITNHEVSSPAAKGDKVIFKKWGANEVKLEGKEYYFIKFDDVLAVIS
jgi:chaperonin GroES